MRVAANVQILTVEESTTETTVQSAWGPFNVVPGDCILRKHDGEIETVVPRATLEKDYTQVPD